MSQSIRFEEYVCSVLLGFSSPDNLHSPILVCWHKGVEVVEYCSVYFKFLIRWYGLFSSTLFFCQRRICRSDDMLCDQDLCLSDCHTTIVHEIVDRYLIFVRTLQRVDVFCYCREVLCHHV